MNENGKKVGNFINGCAVLIICGWGLFMLFLNYVKPSSNTSSSSESSHSSSQNSSSNSATAASSSSDSTPAAPQAQINMPELPQTFTYDDYSSISQFTVKDISYTIDTHYDNTFSAEFTALVTLDSKVGEENVSGSVCFGYKLYDNDNVVVDSGTVFTEAVSAGESTRGGLAFGIWIHQRHTH